jgi:hypothetical protein
MSPNTCESLREHLGAYVDGELAGAEMLRVSQHLEECDHCAGRIDELRGIGGLLRDTMLAGPPTPQLAGLASGVITRVRAESAQSWRHFFHRGVDDWHWLIVGGGSVVATFASMVFASALLFFGPDPARPDSLSALITNLGSSAGRLLIEATPVGDDKDSMLMELDTGNQRADGSAVMPAMLGFPTERDLVNALNQAVVPQGRLVELAAMPEIERRYTESLLDNISRFRLGESTYGSTGPLTVHRVRLVTNTGVSAKAME